MPPAAREIAYRTYRAPRLSSPCLDPVRVVYATPDEAMAEILTAIAPLPNRLEIVAVDVATTQVFNPVIGRHAVDTSDDPPVGVLIVRGLALAEIAQAVINLAARAWEPTAPEVAA